MGKNELSKKVFDLPVVVHSLTYSHALWLVTERIKL